MIEYKDIYIRPLDSKKTVFVLFRWLLCLCSCIFDFSLFCMGR